MKSTSITENFHGFTEGSFSSNHRRQVMLPKSGRARTPLRAAFKHLDVPPKSGTSGRWPSSRLTFFGIGQHAPTSAPTNFQTRSHIGLLPLLVLCAMAPVTNAQVQKAWVTRYNNGLTNAAHQAVAMAFDPSGNIVVAGNSQNAQSNLDYVVIKYSPNGTQLWAARHDSITNGNDQVRGMVLDASGNVYLTGTSDTVKFSAAGAETWSVPHAGRGLAVNSNEELYVTGLSTTSFVTVKLNKIGSNVWLRSYNFKQCADMSQAVVLDSEGNVIVAGSYQWICWEMSYYYRFGILKYNSNGMLLWATNYPSWIYYPGGFAEVKGLLTTATDAIYITGNSLYAGGGKTYFTACVDGNGSVVWDQYYVNAHEEGVTSMAANKAANLCLTGRDLKTVNPDSVVYKTIKADGNGTKLWEADYSAAVPGYNKANSIAVDGAGNIYVTGGSTGSGTGQDWATIKYSPDGRQLWVERYNGPGNGDDEAAAVVLDNAGNVYVTGWATVPGGGTEIVTIKYVQGVSMERRPQGSMRLQLPAAPDQSVGFQFSTNFLDWLLLGTSLADSNGIATFDDTNAPAYPYGFYRAVLP